VLGALFAEEMLDVDCALSSADIIGPTIKINIEIKLDLKNLAFTALCMALVHKFFVCDIPKAASMVKLLIFVCRN